MSINDYIKYNLSGTLIMFGSKPTLKEGATIFSIKKNGEFNDFIFNSQLSGVDRIVPIGQALDINLNWDGYDINKTLPRVVDFKWQK